MDDKRGRFEAEVLPHLNAAYRFARWLSRSPADAEDIVQDAVLRAFRGFDAVRGANVKAWLLTIVRNCHATAFRQEERRAQVPLPDEHDPQHGHAMVSETPDPEGESIRRQESRTLERLIARLPPEQRTVLVLREIEDLGYREIADIMEVPVGTVMSRLARARVALRSLWLNESAGEAHGLS